MENKTSRNVQQRISFPCACKQTLTNPLKNNYKQTYNSWKINETTVLQKVSHHRIIANHCYLMFSDASYPAHISPLYFPGATFDKNYNSHFKPINFTVPDLITKVSSKQLLNFL